jgi:pyruvate-formate lyase-activating enzyme
MISFPVVSVDRDNFVNYPPYWAMTVYCKGCNLCCPECYNRDFVTNPDTPSFEFNYVFDHHVHEMTDAVVFCGGEACSWGDGLLNAIHYVRGLCKNYHIKLFILTHLTKSIIFFFINIVFCFSN